MDAPLLREPVAFAQASETSAPRDLELNHYQTFGREPFGVANGPFRERGPQTGIVIRHGYIVAEWGEPYRVDMTFSVTKIFLSTVVGLARDRGMIDDLHEPAYSSMAPVLAAVPPTQAVEGGRGPLGSLRPFDLFATEHNRKVTWDHLFGRWEDRQILAKEWLALARAPGVNEGYGFMNFFLNTGAEGPARRPGVGVVPPRLRHQPGLLRPGERPGDRGSLDQRPGGGRDRAARSGCPH